MPKITAQSKTFTTRKNLSLVHQYLQQAPSGDKTDGQVSLPKLNSLEALELALQVLLRGDFQERWEVSKILPKLGQAVVIPLIEILDDEAADIEARWFAGRILGQFEQPEVVIALVKLLQNTEDEDLAAMAAQALAEIGDSAVTALQELLLQPELRLLIVQTLSYIRRPQIVEPLLGVVQDPQPKIRAMVIEALSSFRDPRITPVLIAALQDISAAVRQEAVVALSFREIQVPSAQLVWHLQPLMYDFNLQVCQRAVTAMGRIGTDDATEALFDLLKSPVTPTVLQIDAIRALGWAASQSALEYLSEILSGSQVSLCQEIVAVLGRWHCQELRVQVSQILLDFLASEKETAQDTKVKQAAAFSLGQLGVTAAISTLEKLATDEDSIVKLHALSSLKKLNLAAQDVNCEFK